jgi:glycosyltransferase involved in cell wall biosynthesis
MDFSVVVPFFNAEQFIERCIRGLLAQTIPADRYEILMVDNNSKDSSARIVLRFDRAKLLQESEQGSYAARNRGIDHARGEIVAFTDPDCVPQEDWLEQIGQAMADPSAKLVLGDRQFATDSGVLGILAAYESRLVARIFESRCIDHYFAYTNNMAVRMPVLRELGGFQKLQRGADTLFLQSVADRCGGAAVKYVPEMLVRHLEIAGVRDYLDKKATYGQVHRDQHLGARSPLPLTSRCQVALHASRAHCGSLADRIGFFGVLAAGALRFEWQRWRGR